MNLPAGSGSFPRTASSDLVGRRFGRYEILSRIASGGMATVYVARAQGLAGFERLVALKLLHPHLAHEQEFVSMFLDEARLAARIRHPNVVATLDINSSETDGLFLVMEYVEGNHLGKLLAGAAAAGRGLPVPVVLRVICDALQGLGAAHDLRDGDGTPLQLVHRDVSPHNVLVGKDGIARLTDFGVARAEVRLAETRQGQFKGKLGYLAPEQISAGACDRRSDLFAMGVVLWECLAGRRLFRADDTMGMLRAVLHQPILPLAAAREDLAPLGPVLERALARRPEQRFQSAAAFLEALEAVAPEVGGLATTKQVGMTVARYAPPPLHDRGSGLHGTGSGHHRSGSSTFQDYLLATSCSQAPVTGARNEIVGDAGSGHGTPPPLPAPAAPGGVGHAGSFTPPGGPAHPGTTAIHPGGGASSRRHLGTAAAAVILVLVGVIAFLLLGKERESGMAAAPPTPQAATLPSAQPIDATYLTGPDDALPRLLEGTPPLSPAPDAALRPTVVLRLHVDERGDVAEARVYRSRLDLEAFEEAALEAVESYRFTPARKAGQVVPVWFNLPVTFTRPAAPSTILRLHGSDTIGGSLAPALGRAFRRHDPQVAVEVEAHGSSTAFASLFDGSAELGASSRAVRHDEVLEAKRLGIELREFVLGYDGIAVVVHPDNPVRSLTLDQLARIFSGEIRDWRQVGVGPGAIEVISRPSASGTHAFFLEKVLRRGRGDSTASFSPGAIYLEHNDEVVERVSRSPHAVGYVGLGALEAGVRVVPVAAQPGGVAIAPGPDSVADGSYPIYRPLLLYTRGAPEGELARFLRFVLGEEGREKVEEHGFVASNAPVESLLPLEDAGTATRDR